MKGPDDDVLAKHRVDVRSDAPWQQRLRLGQALWREARGLPIGHHNGPGGERPLGSRLAMPHAEDELGNYLSETIRDVVRTTLSDPETSADGKLFSTPRIYEDLLSSQPLCFNAFGELKADLALASRVARHLWPARVQDVTRVEFEHSPGRGNPNYLGNRTAFDVYLEHTRPDGGAGFIGIEIKYHENLQVSAADTRPRIGEVAEASGVFRPDSLDALSRPPLQQVWFDHLLALSMLQADGWDSGLFVLLHPTANPRCYVVSDAYEAHLQDASTYQRLTLEEFVAVARLESGGAQWAVDLHDRYVRYPA